MIELESLLVGRRVRHRFSSTVGTVVAWEFNSPASTDAKVQRGDGTCVWVASRELEPVDELGPLPCLKETREMSRQARVKVFDALLEKFGEESKQAWPGCEFGKGFVGAAIQGALTDTKGTTDA